MAKKFVIQCDYCNHRKVMDSSENITGLIEIPLSTIQSHIPQLNQQAKKIETKPDIPRRKMFKCPGCGRGVVARSYLVPDNEEEKKDEKTDFFIGRETSPFRPAFPGDPTGIT